MCRSTTITSNNKYNIHACTANPTRTSHKWIEENVSVRRQGSTASVDMQSCHIGKDDRYAMLYNSQPVLVCWMHSRQSLYQCTEANGTRRKP